MSSQIKGWISNPEETHGPLMAISLWALTGVSAVFLVLRFVIRLNLGNLWMDDLVVLLGWLFLFAQAVLNQLAVNLGFGKHSFDIDFSVLERITYYGATGLTLSTMAINLSKISFGITLLRLTDSWAKWYTWFAIGTLAAFALPVAILPWVQCRPLVKTFVDLFPGECIDKRPSVKFAEFQAVWAALMDVSLALLPWTVIWNVQMRMTEKIGIGVAMSLGILAAATAIMRAIYVQQLTQQDISYDATKSVIWSAAESALTIVATSIPVLRAFVNKKIGSAIEYIRSSSNKSANASAPKQSNAASRAVADSLRLTTALSKKEASRHASRSSHLIGNPKHWISLDDISDTIDVENGKEISCDK